MALAVLVARRHLLAATLLAAAASVAVSGAVADESLNRWALRQTSSTATGIVGMGAWPGIGELAGMAVLCAMAIRYRPHGRGRAGCDRLRRRRCWRSSAGASKACTATLFLLILGVAFAATVATGLYSRSIEQRRADDARATRQSERDAIARELHDLVAHHVTGIVVQAQAARLVAAARPDITANALSSIERAGADALQLDARHGGGAARRRRAMRRSRRRPRSTTSASWRRPAASHLPVVVSLDPAAERLPSSVTASLHRIAIEALTNARRHGTGATTVDVAVACGPQHVTLSVTNDGAVVTDRQQGFGLVGIAERVAALGGQLRGRPASDRRLGGHRRASHEPPRATDSR